MCVDGCVCVCELCLVCGVCEGISGCACVSVCVARRVCANFNLYITSYDMSIGAHFLCSRRHTHTRTHIDRQRVCADNEIYGNSRRHSGAANAHEEYATNLLYLICKKNRKEEKKQKSCKVFTLGASCCCCCQYC